MVRKISANKNKKNYKINKNCNFGNKRLLPLVTTNNNSTCIIMKSDVYPDHNNQ